MFGQGWLGRGIDSRVVVMAMQLLSRIGQLEQKPPVTLVLIAINVAAWLRLGPLAMLLAGPDPMMCPHDILIGRRPWLHLFLAAFIHASDGGFHLFYNMSSLLWKGVTLELEMGSERFAIMVAAVLLISHALFVPLSYLATSIFGLPTYHSCAVGFSAVLFGLKVVMNHSEVGQRAVGHWGLHFPVEAKYAAWVELVLISLVVPEASFVGHLCGILAGVLWLHAEPLAARTCAAARHNLRSRSERRSWGSGRLGSADSTASRSTDLGFTSDMDEASQIREAVRRSRRDF
eukprot:CAMPEP_0115137412 /NCGR_PEP_ID=MMETSP0227-20121206/57016_1 /TAXON_ID=89957 /ORGANISM="Polarella glacialis, Strain CCMP 1383" /LENGTH=288 /DNA_ID=CAMNT_0002544757 /DNA_START=54 /DNA_END=920 /DNA_ORIENTATION=-